MPKNVKRVLYNSSMEDKVFQFMYKEFYYQGDLFCHTLFEFMSRKGSFYLYLEGIQHRIESIEWSCAGCAYRNTMPFNSINSALVIIRHLKIESPYRKLESSFSLPEIFINSKFYFTNKIVDIKPNPNMESADALKQMDSEMSYEYQYDELCVLYEKAENTLCMIKDKCAVCGMMILVENKLTHSLHIVEHLIQKYEKMRLKCCGMDLPEIKN